MKKTRGGDITKISELFAKYVQRLQAPQGTVIKTFQEVVHDLFGITIRKEQCSYTVSTRTLALTLPGPIKSEILLKKKEILTHLKGRLGEKSAPQNIL